MIKQIKYDNFDLIRKRGAEKFASLLSFMLENLNIEVHTIIINDAVDYEYAGELLNLGIDSERRFLF
jgi:hypothetical protein